MGNIIIRDFLIEISDATESEIHQAVREVESILCDTEAINIRINYLQGIELAGIKGDEKPVNKILDPLTDSERQLCVEKGIVKTVEDNDIAPEKILKLAHSVDGLQNFTDSLFEIDEENHAEVWKNAFSVSSDVPDIDYSFLNQRSPLEKVIESVIAWIDSMVEPAPTLAVSLRGQSDEETGFDLDLDDQMNYGAIISSQLEMITEFAAEIPDNPIAAIIKRFPIDKLKSLTTREQTWREFTSDAGSIVSDYLNASEIDDLKNWILSESLSREDSSTKLYLLLLLLNTAQT